MKKKKQIFQSIHAISITLEAFLYRSYQYNLPGIPSLSCSLLDKLKADDEIWLFTECGGKSPAENAPLAEWCNPGVSVCCRCNAGWTIDDVIGGAIEPDDPNKLNGCTCIDDDVVGGTE